MKVEGANVTPVLCGSGTITSFTIQENETGFCSVDGTINNNQPGYTGDGFSNTANATGNGINWKIFGDAGSYTFTWNHACPSDRQGELFVNGVSVLGAITFNSTTRWDSWEENTSITVNLAEGIKDIRIESLSTNGLGNIDYMKVEGPNANTVSCDGQARVSGKTDLVVSNNDISLENDNAIRVYSNLSSSTFTLSENVVQVEVYSMNGQLVKSFPRNERSFDISELSSGVYLLKVVSEKGTKEILKIIKV
jgi:hypothetical protein